MLKLIRSWVCIDPLTSDERRNLVTHDPGESTKTRLGLEINNMAAVWRTLPRGATNFRLVSRLFSTGKHSKTALDLRLEPYEFIHESIFNEEHAELRASLNKFIEKEINPFVDEWENAKRFPAHELFKKLGSAGFFGVNKPTKYGGLGLDYSFSVAMAEELGKLFWLGV